MKKEFAKAGELLFELGTGNYSVSLEYIKDRRTFLYRFSYKEYLFIYYILTQELLSVISIQDLAEGMMERWKHEIYNRLVSNMLRN